MENIDFLSFVGGKSNFNTERQHRKFHIIGGAMLNY